MPHVAWLFEYPTLNGGEFSLLASLAAIRASGFRVTAVAPRQGPLAKTLAVYGVEVAAFDTYGAASRQESQAKRRENLSRLLRDLRPDLLHANSLAMGRLSGPVVTDLGLSSLAHLRDILGLSAAAVRDLNCHSRLLAVSQAVRNFHVAQGLAAEKTRVLYNGIDLERFQPRASGQLRLELRLPPHALLIGSIGQLIVRKGCDVLAAAAANLAAELPQAHYVIVGERYSEKPEARQYLADLEAAWQQAGLADRVHWLGRREDVELLLADFDVLVHAARQEPLGRVLLEAAAAGRAIVCTDVGGTREIFPGSQPAARIVPPGDAASLADAIRELAGDAELRVRLGRAARHRAEEAFDIRQAAAKLVEQYREVISNGRVASQCKAAE